MDYLWLKAVHIAAVLIFTGGLFAQTFGVAAGTRGQSGAARLITLWDKRVTAPAMLAAWLSGATVAVAGHWFSDHWLWLKLVIVVALTGLHGFQAGKLRRSWGNDDEGVSTRPLFILASIALSVAGIAVLAVAKPF
jgi:putative membrane protein